MKKLIRGINGYFIRMLLSFLLLVLVPVAVIGGTWYKMAKNQDMQYQIERQQERMKAIGLELERRIHSVEVDLLAFQYSKSFLKYAKDTDEDSILEIREEIQGLVKKNPIFTSLYIYDTKNNKIYNSLSGMYEVSTFYDIEWLNDIEDLVRLRRLPLRQSLNKDLYRKYKGTEFERIYPCHIYLSILSQKTFDLYLLANIDVRGLGEYIQKIYPLNLNEKAYLVSEDMQILYSNEYQSNQVRFEEDVKEIVDKGKNFWSTDERIYFVEKTPYDEIYYIESYLESEFFKTQNGNEVFIIIVCVILSIFLTILAYIISLRLYQPIKNLYREIRKTPVISRENKQENLDVLQKAFIEMSKRYESSIKEEESYREFMRMSSLYMVLNGTYRQEKFFQDNNQIYLKSGMKGYQLIIFQLISKNNMTEQIYENFCFRLKSVINSYLQAISKGIFTEVEEACFGVFYTVNDESDAEYTKQVLIEAVRKFAGDENYFISSQIISKEECIKNLYKIYRRRIKNAIFFEAQYGEVGDVGEEHDMQEMMDLSINYEKDLIRAIVIKNEEEISKVLSRLYQELKMIYRLDDAINICNRVMVTLDKEFDIYKVLNRDIQEECQWKNTLNELIEYIQSILLQVVDQVGGDSSTENRYCKEAKLYLEQNYMRDINITEVAEHLGISYAYLSKIFKTQSEGNGRLSDYLNIIRINKSKEYLKDTRLTLAEVAENVGYNNVQSFQRFFKKYENMTPGEFKKYLYQMNR